MANYETIIYEKKNSVAKITLNRPEALNAITRTMFLEIGQALDDAEQDNSVRVVLLTGSGKSFCAGVDMKFSQAELLTLHDKQEFFKLGNKAAVEKMENLSKPVIAAVHGYCLAGGFELMMGADFVIAAEDAVIGDQHVNIALFGGGGCYYRLVLLVGIRKAKEIILLGQQLSGKEAAELGIANRAVPADDLHNAVDKMALELAEKSPVAVRFSKAYINKVGMMDADTRLELAMMYSLVESTSEDAQEGPRAFTEKRKPDYQGK